jgi:hypothetical protein
MPGYSFQPQFVEPIRAGTKGGTIRLARRMPAKWPDWTKAKKPGGHARQGERLMLWCKLRTPQAFYIGERECVGAEPIHLVTKIGDPNQIAFPDRNLMLHARRDLDAFAVFDGFEDWDGMAAFWRSAHGDLAQFTGWHIRWLPLPAAIDRHYQVERIERARAADWAEHEGSEA